MLLPPGVRSARFFPHWNPYGPFQLEGFIKLCLDINNLGTELTGVEIGSFYGESANLLLSFPHVKKLTCVDIFIQPYLEQRLKHHIDHNRLVTKQMTSIEAADLFEDASLDFVYIDADHSYDAVVADLAAWYPKLKTNGLFCGHDYLVEENANTVVKAVDEFFAANNLTLKWYTDSSWSAVKVN